MNSINAVHCTGTHTFYKNVYDCNTLGSKTVHNIMDSIQQNKGQGKSQTDLKLLLSL